VPGIPAGDTVSGPARKGCQAPRSRHRQAGWTGRRELHNCIESSEIMDLDVNQFGRDYANVWDVAAPEDLADRLYAPDVVDHNLQPGQGAGLDGIKQVIGVYRSVFPDLHLTCDDVLSSGDRIAVRWSATGTHEGGDLGVPPTHKKAQLTGIDIVRIEDGRIAERWGETNGLELMAQLGAA
jgi:predicted ester cyclase